MTAWSYFSKINVISVEFIKLPLFKMNQLVKKLSSYLVEVSINEVRS